ncbi:putative inactive glycosyltransferase 25 family member 3 [Porphyridium purpureum]|uniref:Putative inactive glycosyltransferase 25 family member 3 n=1 Tax=Porphyridium purpureum TaxID=35688 RepID=A0A5J4Z9I3_PORPP|nr:putative inactive glycosyltransferase 25 family member 3 [Porphyridium purpureum]|eukprot:POR4547..scf295_1
MKQNQAPAAATYDSDDDMEFQTSRRSLEFAGPQAGDARSGNNARKISIHRNESDDTSTRKNPAKSSNGAGLKDKLKAKFAAASTARLERARPISAVERGWDEELASGQGKAFGDLGVDKIYVVNLESCPSRWKLMEKWARRSGINMTRFLSTSFNNLDWERMPLAVVNLDYDTRFDSVTKGQVGCSMTHVRIMRDAWFSGLQRVLVLEDDVYLTDEMMATLKHDLDEIDERAAVLGKPWHYLFLRRYSLHSVLNDPVYVELSRGLKVTHPQPSWGNSAYVLSRAGMEWLLSHFIAYEVPIDVQIATYQQLYPDFVALCLCNSGMDFKHQCPENTVSFTDEMRAECSYSASQSGGRKYLPEFPHMLRFVDALDTLNASEFQVRRRWKLARS